MDYSDSSTCIAIIAETVGIPGNEAVNRNSIGECRRQSAGFELMATGKPPMIRMACPAVKDFGERTCPDWICQQCSYIEEKRLNSGIGWGLRGAMNLLLAHFPAEPTVPAVSGSTEPATGARSREFK